MMQALLLQSVDQRSENMLLTNYVSKLLWAPFSG